MDCSDSPPLLLVCSGLVAEVRSMLNGRILEHVALEAVSLALLCAPLASSKRGDTLWSPYALLIESTAE